VLLERDGAWLATTVIAVAPHGRGMLVTLDGIADRFSVNAEDVRKWNRLRSNHVGRGMVLRIYTIGGPPEASPARIRSKPKKKPAPTAGSASGTAATSKQPT